VPGPKDGVAWEFPPQWGEELQTEHEKYLAEVVYKKPVIVYNYPKKCKAFYMRLNDDDATVGAMDVLFPRVGEMVGGAARDCTRLHEIARALPARGRDGGRRTVAAAVAAAIIVAIVVAAAAAAVIVVVGVAAVVVAAQGAALTELWTASLHTPPL